MNHLLPVIPALLLGCHLFTSCSLPQSPAEPQYPLHQFTASEVRLLPSEFQTRQQWDSTFLLSLDVDRLLYYFLDEEHREGLEPYGAWEEMDIKGHTLGHYLTAMSMLYAQTGDEEVLRRVGRAVDGMEECQQRLGTGLITAFRLDLLDECETQGTGWAPYYTLHKLLQGLLDAYTFTGNDKALQMATRFGDHIVAREQSLRERGIDWNANLDIMEVGGFGESMLNLYALTQRPEHLEAARFFHQMSKLQPAAEGRDQLNDPVRLSQHRVRQSPNHDRYHNMHHSNATIPQFLTAARDFELTGDSLYWLAASNFWQMVVDHRTYSNGTTGCFEHWNYGPDSLLQELDIKAGETCCTYNMIKLSNELFRLHPDVRYADYVERALVNDIMGTIYPETADFTYFHTQQPGTFKTFGRNAECFWCCTGTGMESHQRYVESIYFTDGQRLYVNLPITSTLDWRERGIRLRLQSGFPYEGPATFTIEQGSGAFTLCVRVPFWCKGYQVAVNGESVEADYADGYIMCERSWREGDEVTVTTVYPIRFEPLAGDSSVYSFFYGPMLMAADMGEAPQELIRVTDNFYGRVPDAYQSTADIPALPTSRGRLNMFMEAMDAAHPMWRFRFPNDETSLPYLPLYQIHDRRFSAYTRLQPVGEETY